MLRYWTAGESHGKTLLAMVDASVGGKLAQIGSRLIDATAKKMADDFFSRLADIVGGPPAAEGLQPEAAAAEARKLPAYLWVGGLVAIMIILLLVFTNM